MKTSTKVALATSAAILVVAVLAIRPWAPRESPPAGTASDRGAPAFALQPGSSRAYDLSFSTSVSAAGSAPRRTTFDGQLNVRVVAAEAGGPALAVQLHPLRVRVDGEPQPEMERRYALPFVVPIEPRGRLGASLFPPGLAQGDRAVLDGTIRAFQIVLPPDARDTWEENETDPIGTFTASYRRGPGGVVEKTKARYVSLRPPALFRVQVLASAVRAEVDAAGPWLARAAGSERLEFTPEGGAALAAVEARFTLEPAGVPDASAALWRDDAVKAARVGVDAATEASSAWDEADRAAARRRFADGGVTLEKLVVRARGARLPDAALAHELAAFLRVFPESAAQIPPRLGRTPDDASALLLHALELAGTPEAQDALADVVESGEQARGNRIRALVAMSGVEAPTAETLARMERDARFAGYGEAGEIAATALLTLGALVPRAPDDARERITSDLSAELRGTRDPGRQRHLLLALENARATLPSEALAPHLASESAGVREIAARLAGSAQGGDPVGDLVAMLAREQNGEVRAQIVAGLLARPADARANAAVVRALTEGREPVAAVRLRMVGYLRQQYPVFPANRDVLRAYLPRETDRNVTVAILNAIAG